MRLLVWLPYLVPLQLPDVSSRFACAAGPQCDVDSIQMPCSHAGCLLFSGGQQGSRKSCGALRTTCGCMTSLRR